MPVSESKSKMLHIMQYDLVTENVKCYGVWKDCLADKCVMFFHHQRWISRTHCLSQKNHL